MCFRSVLLFQLDLGDRTNCSTILSRSDVRQIDVFWPCGLYFLFDLAEKQTCYHAAIETDGDGHKHNKMKNSMDTLLICKVTHFGRYDSDCQKTLFRLVFLQVAIESR